MLCTFGPPTILNDFYRIPEKSPKLAMDKMDRACEQKDQTLKSGPKGIPKNLSSQHFGEVRVNFLVWILTQTPDFICRRPESFRKFLGSLRMILRYWKTFLDQTLKAIRTLHFPEHVLLRFSLSGFARILQKSPNFIGLGRTLGYLESQFLPWAICRNVLEDFCCINFGGFSRGFSWRIFLGTFSHKNEEIRSGEKIREKIRRLKNKNPRKIRSAESRP